MVGVHRYAEGDEGDTTIADKKSCKKRVIRAAPVDNELSGVSAAVPIAEQSGVARRPASYRGPVPYARALVREALGRRHAKPKLPKLDTPEWAVDVSWARSRADGIDAYRVDGGVLLKGGSRLAEKGSIVLGIEGLRYTVSLEIGDGFHEAAERVTQRVMPGYEAVLEYPEEDCVLIRLKECALDDMLAALRTAGA